MEELKTLLSKRTLEEIEEEYRNRVEALVSEILTQEYPESDLEEEKVIHLPQIQSFIDDSVDDFMTTIESAFDLEDTIKSDLEDVVYDALVNKGIISTFDEEEDAEIGMINPIPDSWPSAKKLQKELDQIEKEEENETSSVWNDWD